jgi:hypothetical protein
LHDKAKSKAISEALYFEDQERVRHLIYFTVPMIDGEIPHGAYPIPPDFPKVVEVRQWNRKIFPECWVDLIHNQDVYGDRPDKYDYRTVLRFVDKKQEITRIQDDPDFKRGVEKAKQESEESREDYIRAKIQEWFIGVPQQSGKYIFTYEELIDLMVSAAMVTIKRK